jgi:hypothetical protein
MNLLGFETVDGFRDPCFRSQGVNDFWGACLPNTCSEK